LQSWVEPGDLEKIGRAKDALQKQGAGQNVCALHIKNLANAICTVVQVAARDRFGVSKILKKQRQFMGTFSLIGDGQTIN